jgi:16S rRNA A1518/A1519 N6-dimethyltransferase RsmA/KsgA/DIM1 with predicted DNA glycosylase/AP lyase activity
VAVRRSARARRAARSQHFLRSDAVASALVRDAGIGPGDLVLDLGAGSGRLTSALARRAGRVIAVELDSRWAAHLRGRWANVEVVQGDAALAELPREAFHVVANLPFDRTTAILRHLLDDPRVPLLRADVVVEWDVAVKRCVPWPSNVNDVLWGAWYRFTLLRRLHPRAFDPSPGVAAGVIAIERRPVSLVAETHWQAYRRFVATAFRHGAGPTRRVLPRDLDAHAWAELFRRQAH